MRLLVTNDDGIGSEGIAVLARHLDGAGHDVVVVAPDRNFSGSGAALGDLAPDQGLAVEQVKLDGIEHVEAWALDGPPALTVVAAVLGAFGEPPDLVVSGINAGLNTGRAILHSGTVGAALTGQNFGISGLAVSLDAGTRWHWETAAIITTGLVAQVAEGPARCVVNLNVPARRLADVEGIRWARLAPFGAVRAAIATRAGDQVQFELTAGHDPAPDTDQGSVEAGWASLTTLIGTAEAWPDRVDDEPVDDIELAVAPGAPVHPVQRIPDASDHRVLRRPLLGV